MANKRVTPPWTFLGASLWIGPEEIWWSSGSIDKCHGSLGECCRENDVALHARVWRV